MAIKLNDLDNVLMTAFVQGITLEMLSAPGIGKSSKVHQTAKKMATKLGKPFCLAVRHLSTFDPTECAGLQFISKKEITFGPKRTKLEFESAVASYPALFPADNDTVFLPDGKVTNCKAHGIPEFGWVFLDELRQAPHDVQKPTARFMDERRIGDWDLRMFGGQWSVVAASNNTEDRSGVNKDLAFITNRKLVLQVETSVQMLCEYFEETKSVHDHAIAYVRAFPQNVISEKVPAHDGPFPTPRSFERTARMLKAMGNGTDLDTSPMAVEVAGGLVGVGAGAEFCAFLRRLDDMVTIEEILENPKQARIPERLDVAWAVVQMLLGHVTVRNFEKLFTYVDRLPKEMQITCVSGMLHRVPDLALQSGYSAWARANKDLLMAAFAADRRLKR